MRPATTLVIVLLLVLLVGATVLQVFLGRSSSPVLNAPTSVVTSVTNSLVPVESVG